MLYASPYIDKYFFDTLKKQVESIETTSYPPVNIYSNKESTFIEIALAGFKEEELTIILDNNILVVKGKKEKDIDQDIIWRQHQISNKSFTRKFPLAEYAEVINAIFEDGLLKLELQVIVPDDKKPKQIQITNTKLLDSKQE